MSLAHRAVLASRAVSPQDRQDTGVKSLAHRAGLAQQGSKSSVASVEEVQGEWQRKEDPEVKRHSYTNCGSTESCVSWPSGLKKPQLKEEQRVE